MTMYGYARVSTRTRTWRNRNRASGGRLRQGVSREGERCPDRPRRAGEGAPQARAGRRVAGHAPRSPRAVDRDLLNIIDTIAKREAGFQSLKDAWCDTTTPHGRLMLTVLGAWPNSSASSFARVRATAASAPRPVVFVSAAPTSSHHTSARKPCSASQQAKRYPMSRAPMPSIPRPSGACHSGRSRCSSAPVRTMELDHQIGFESM